MTYLKQKQSFSLNNTGFNLYFDFFNWQKIELINCHIFAKFFFHGNKEIWHNKTL